MLINSNISIFIGRSQKYTHPWITNFTNPIC